MKDTNQLNLAWLAGFFDGEGCVIINKRLKPRAVNYCYDLQLHINNTNRALLEHCVEITELGNISKRTAHRNPKWKPYCGWALTSNRARECLVAMLPYLIAKKEHAELAIKFQDNINLGKQTYWGGRYKTTPKDYLEFRESVYLKIKRLNRRGVQP